MAEVRISCAVHEHVKPSSTMMAEAFKNDPGVRFVLSNLSDRKRSAVLQPLLRSLYKAAALNSGLIEEANDWESCAVWLPPGARVDNIFTAIQSGFVGTLFKIGPVGMKRMVVDFQKEADKCKQIGLKGYSGYNYLFFIGTAEHARGQGLASEIIRRHQVTSQRDNLPIWLEATTAHARDVYMRCGFELVKEIRLGKGTHDSDGSKKKDGPGVGIWAMIWKPAPMLEKTGAKSSTVVSIRELE